MQFLRRFLFPGAAVILSLSAFTARAGVIESDGTLDLSFDAGKITDGDVRTSLVQPDGKLIIAGTFGQVNGVLRRNIARLNGDGSLDASFDAGAGPNSAPSQILLQSSGKIIIVGEFLSVSGAIRWNIARLNSNGSLDPNYYPRTFEEGEVPMTAGISAAVLQSDDKLVVVGFFSSAGNSESSVVGRHGVARFNADGSFDASFDPGSGFELINTFGTPWAKCIVRLSDNRVVIAGLFDAFNGHPVGNPIRLNANGSLDNSFSTDGPSPQDSITGLLTQADGEVVLFGNLTAFGEASRNGIARLNGDGSLDTDFAPAAFANYTEPGGVSAMAQQSDGKLVVTGEFHAHGGFAANGIARLDLNGARDGSFQSTLGTGVNGLGRTVAVRSDDKIFVGGYFSTFGGANRQGVALAQANGALDTGFAPAPGVTDGSPQVYAISTQSDGKVIVGGTFNSVNGAPHYHLVRLLTNGSVDESFAVGEGVSRSVRAVLVLPNNKILVGGQFLATNGQAAARLVQLTVDGSVDPSFNLGAAGVDGTVYSIARDAAGNIFLGGFFETVAGAARYHLAKLSPSGALDTTFAPLAGPAQTGGGSDQVFALIAPFSANGLVLGGAFTSYDFELARRIARVNATTAQLQNFTQGNGFNSTVRALALTPTGKYLATGTFSSYNGVARARIARLNDDGTLDSTFAPSPALTNIGEALAVQGARAFVSGNFTTPVRQMARLSPTGVLESAFTTGTGAIISPTSPLGTSIPQDVTALAIEPGGKLLLGGLFNQYNGVPRFSLARLTGPSLSIDSISRAANSQVTLQGTGAASRSYTLEATPNLASQAFAPIGTVQTNAQGRFEFMDMDAAMFPTRSYRLTLN